MEFAQKGYRVFATARSLKTLANLQEKGIEVLTLDVTNPESIIALKTEISNRTGGSLDMLFNNAGTCKLLPRSYRNPKRLHLFSNYFFIVYEAPAIEADPSRVRALFDTNVFGLMEMVSAFAPLLLASVTPNSKPTIINVASVLARLPNPFASAYNASKAAVASYSDTLRLELQPLGVRVVTLYMGEVSTPLMAVENIRFGPDSIYAEVEDAVKSRTTTHLEKTMPPAEFARQVVSELVGGYKPYLWKGTNAFTVWLLNAIGPRTIFDSTLIKGAGLDGEEAQTRIFKRGQVAAKQGK